MIKSFFRLGGNNNDFNNISQLLHKHIVYEFFECALIGLVISIKTFIENSKKIRFLLGKILF